jgi:hypothetical protein
MVLRTREDARAETALPDLLAALIALMFIA